MKICSYFIFILLLFSCKQQPFKPPLFQLMEHTGVDFANNIHNTKDFNIFIYRNFYNGGGAAIGDINNDGLADIFFTANMGSNKLYLNKGNFKFEDISAKAGFSNKSKWSTGVVFADVNGDGWLDIYVCNSGYQKGVSNENELYINNHDLTFTERAKEYGLNESGYTTHAAFFDYDLDGDLDCYVLKNSFIPVNTLNYANKREVRAEDWPVADFLKGGGDKLLRNDQGKFTDVSQQANIYGSLIGFGLGVTVGDVNGDHYPDLYISNDFFERDYLYLNQRDGTFKEDLENCMQHISNFSMGADIGDINNDGFPDIFTTDMLPDDDYRLRTTTSFESYETNQIKVASGFYNQFMQNTLQVNNRAGKFLETGYYSGVAASDWSWGGLMFDADNDALLDIFVSNGIYHDMTDQDFIDFFADEIIQRMVMTGKKEDVDEIADKMPSQPLANKAFRNLGNLRFTDHSAAWGLDQSSFSNGAAYGDLDNDGDLDLVVNNVNQKAFVYKNNSREQLGNDYIGFSLSGRDDNTFAVGSTIKVYIGGQVLSREIVPSRGFQSSVDYKTIIGLGKQSHVDSVIIIWPDRSVFKMNAPLKNKIHSIKQASDALIQVSNQIVKPDGRVELIHEGSSPLFDSVQNIFERHKEDQYADFYNERNIPVMLSHEGPKAAVGDVNGDGMDDVYIGGAAGQPGQLYLQTSKGFEKKHVPVFEQLALFEDVSALFFDADNDKDLDLFVGSGGNHMPAQSREYQNRLYVNDAKGNFEISVHALPFSGLNTALAAAHDFDRDGDLDLFVGSRSYPQGYGITPQSYLYQNNGSGIFTDVTKAVGPTLSGLGMITGALWTDVTGDQKEDLVIVGEWMPPRIFTFQNNHFKEFATSLTDLHGWWQTVTSADLDGDGDQDLVMGNIGENFYLRPDADRPVKLWMNDFDGNGAVEKIITRTLNKRDMPVFLKREVTEQVVSLRKQNLKHSEFAKKSIQELFDGNVLKKSSVKHINYMSTIIAYNEGQGKFTVQELPLPVQLSSVNAIRVSDINKDGKPDLVMGGNKFGLLPQFSRLDASYGHVLLNKGKREFQYLNTNESGIEVRGEVRDIVEIRGKGRGYWLWLQNNEKPVLFNVSQGRLVAKAKGAVTH